MLGEREQQSRSNVPCACLGFEELGPSERARGWEMPGSLVAKPPCVVEGPGAKRGGSDRAVCNVSEA
jgi:hypothetical protein